MNQLLVNGKQKEIDIHGVISNPSQADITNYIVLHVAVNDYENCCAVVNGKELSVSDLFKSI